MQGRIGEGDLIRIFNLFHTLGLSLYAPELQEEALLQGLKEFQEHLGGKLTVMLLDALGTGVDVHEMDSNLIVKALHLLQNWEDRHALR